MVDADPSVIVKNVTHSYSSGRRLQLFRKKAPAVKVLNEVSLVAFPGEAIGVLGVNGSGKSTLLGLIAGNLRPQSGEVLVASDASLLGVSAALQPDQNAWENARLGLLAMGISSEKVDEMVENVVLWAALGEAAFRPMRTYSSGMQARLKFSISTAVPRDLLLIDEALSTGDSTFAKRSKRRVDDLIGGAGTVFLVSHSPGQVEEYCSRSVWLHEGSIIADTETWWVTRAYQKWVQYVSNDRPDLAAKLISEVSASYSPPRFHEFGDFIQIS